MPVSAFRIDGLELVLVLDAIAVPRKSACFRLVLRACVRTYAHTSMKRGEVSSKPLSQYYPLRTAQNHLSD